ncbi:MAG: isochorismatase family protein [Alkalibacterium sp.]|nr:isochorismatase family protein [Alkalibacterium sp.]
MNDILEKAEVKNLEICGLETQHCVDATVKFAHGLGYTIQMQKGIHGAWDNQYMTGEETVRFYEEIWDNFFVTFV